MARFLNSRGVDGVSLPEIYAAVRSELGEATRDTSIRGVLYSRLSGSKVAYKPTNEYFPQVFALSHD